MSSSSRVVAGIAVALLVLGVAAAFVLRGGPTEGARDGSSDNRGSLGSGRPRTRKGTKPNVLIFLTDDQRAQGTLGVMPSTRRWFARGGTTFTKAYATTPECCPSRASIMSGRYAHNHGVRENIHAERLEHRATLQSYLREAGYVTAIFGKFLNSWPRSEDPPYFNEWAVGQVTRYNGGEYNVNGDVRDVQGYSTDFLTRRAVDFLHRSEDKDGYPWLMFVAPGAPHDPAIPEKSYAGARVPRWDLNPAITEVDRSDKPPYVRQLQASRPEVRKLRANQLRTLMSVDDMVDRVMRTVRRLGEERNTLAFFMSDNGLMWFEHGLARAWRSKRSPYTQSAQIPMMMRWPGHVETRARDNRLVANIDILPTVLDALGDAEPNLRYPLDGRSLLRSGERASLLLEHWETPPKPIPDWASVLTKSFQYVEYYRAGEVTFTEYYDLEADPWQLDNLLHDGVSANDPDLRAAIRRLDRFRRCRAASCP